MINPTIELQNLFKTGKIRLLKGTNRTLCTPGPRRKEQRPHKRLTQTAVSVQESPAEVWVDGGLLQGWEH